MLYTHFFILCTFTPLSSGRTVANCRPC